MRSNSEDILDAAVAGIGIVPAYQPIVSLVDGQVVGFEALARWPQLDDPSPQRVITHAVETGQLDRLDRACIDAAIRGALDSELPDGSLLLVNCEPGTPYMGRSDDEVMDRGHGALNLMFEFTERDLLVHPRTVLRKAAALRADGFAIALDDIGVHPDSLALLDVVCPDIMKLDIDLVQFRPRADQARTLSAVLAHHERTGAVILAEGIETDEHLEQALGLGASLGQGYRYGRAASLTDQRPIPWSPPQRGDGEAPAADSPFELIAGRVPIRAARKETLHAFTRHIESQAMLAADPPMVLAALQHAEHYTDRTRGQYRKLAQTCPLVAIFAEALPEESDPRVRAIALNSADSLCKEWTVVVLGPHHCVALLARELGLEPGGPEPADEDRRFEFAITYDRTLVTEAARNMLDRML
ncbi:EAL domain-containing protein [Mycolicibacterium sp. S2-37]|nr:EAL domain-containing protein [Mycolicibacterium sp. S2-37]